MTRWDRGNLPVVSVVVTRPLMVWVSPVKGFVAVPLYVVVSVISRSSCGYGPSSMDRHPWGGV